MSDDDRLVARCHGMLLRLAGSLPDPALAEARHRLGGGPQAAAATAALVADALAEAQTPVTSEDRELLDLLGHPPGPDVRVRGGTPAPEFLFAPAPLTVLREFGDRIGTSMDFTYGPDTLLVGEVEVVDDIDAAVIAAVAGTARSSVDAPGTPIGLWRAWRYADPGDPAPRRVYLAEVAPGGAPWALTVAVQDVLSGFGEETPLVEVFEPWEPFGPYQSMARTYSALLWAAQPGRPLCSAQVYDFVDESSGVGGFDSGHPRIEDAAERAALLHYLDAGIALAITDALIDDAVDPSQRACVPLNLRTDGEWIWTDTVHYYLGQHRLSPDPRLVDHIRERRDPPPEMLDGVAVFRAMHHLHRSPAAL